MIAKGKIIFSTKVLEIGSEVSEFKSINMAILFGNEAPDVLRSSCFIIDVKPIAGEIVPGMKIIFDNQLYTITAVGSEAQNNLERLGHTTISFTSKKIAELPGTIYVSGNNYPSIKKGSKIQIIH